MHTGKKKADVFPFKKKIFVNKTLPADIQTQLNHLIQRVTPALD